MKSIKKQLSLCLVLLLITSGAIAQSLSSRIDALMSEKYPDDGPGATILVAKEGKTLYRNAFGKANLELAVPMKPENIFEIGSITKQFTAVSILMLEEQGKLSVTDKLSKYLPEYPKADDITIHHLLNHTSGIKSYTEMGDLNSFARNDKTPIELIDFFKNEPMDFEPGEQWHYNNSGYIILGHIIELVSGESYEEYVQTNIFDKLGMKNSFYGSKSRLIKNRANGYMPSENGFRNADYISMSLPYAAGSLMSCVDDMLKWHTAVHSNSLISAKSKAKAHSNTTLNNGKTTNYGYGWQIDLISDVPSIEHGGGIFGYVTQGVYIPSENVYVIVLTNANGNSPQEVTVEIAAMAMGKPLPSVNDAITLARNEMEQWVGKYLFEGDVIRTISFENGSLYSQREGSERLKIFPVGKTAFQFEDSFTKYEFSMEAGKKIAMFQSRIIKSKGVETDKKSTSEKEGITLSSDILEQYVGTYELQPGLELVISVKGTQAFGDLTGQQQVEIFAEAKDEFFLKVVPAKLTFGRDESGNVNAVTLKQGGREMLGKKKS